MGRGDGEGLRLLPHSRRSPTRRSTPAGWARPTASWASPAARRTTRGGAASLTAVDRRRPRRRQGRHLRGRQRHRRRPADRLPRLQRRGRQLRRQRRPRVAEAPQPLGRTTAPATTANRRRLRDHHRRPGLRQPARLHRRDGVVSRRASSLSRYAGRGRGRGIQGSEISDLKSQTKTLTQTPLPAYRERERGREIPCLAVRSPGICPSPHPPPPRTPNPPSASRASATPPSASTSTARWIASPRVPISLHCWQGDDVGGFERRGSELGGGLAVTGNYPGKARTPDELRADIDKALSLIPGRHRLNLHASYAETGGAQRRARRAGAAALSELDRLGQSPRPARARLQPDLLRPPARRRAASRSPTPTPASARSGSATASPAAASARRWAGRWARRPSPTSGSPTAPRTRPPTASRRASGWRDSLDELFAEPLDPAAQPRRRRGQAVRHRLRELRRRLATSFTWATR